jgi:hypothetical protein
MSDVNWNPSKSGNWQTDDDWSGGVGPGLNDVAVLGGTSQYVVTISAPENVGGVEIDDYAAELSVVGAAPVVISGDLENLGEFNVDSVAGSGGATVSIGGELTNTDIVDIGNTTLSAPASLTVGQVDNLYGQIYLEGSAIAQATLSVDAPAGFGAAGEIEGTVSLADDAAVVFATGELTSITSNSSLSISGANAFVEDQNAPQSQSALTGLASNSGSLTLADGAALTLTGALTNTGELSLETAAGASNATELGVNAAAGLGAVGEITGYVDLTDDSILQFASGDITEIASNSSLSLSGAAASVQTLDAPSPNSALTTLATNSGSLTLEGGASLALSGGLTNTGSITLYNGVGAPAPTSLSIDSAAGFGTAGIVTGRVSIEDDSTITFASGQIYSIASGSGLTIDGPQAYLQDADDSGSNSALVDLTSNSGVLTLEDDASLSLVGGLSSTGGVTLDNTAQAAAPTVLDINSAAGLGANGVVTGQVSIVGDSLLEFNSGSFNSIAGGASLSVSGDDAFVADASNPSSNSALTGLNANDGYLQLSDGASLTLNGGLTNSGSLELSNAANAETQTRLVIHSLAGFGTAGAVTGDVSVNDDSAIVFDSGQISAINSSASLYLSGEDAFIADASDPAANSALAGLSDVAGYLSLTEGAQVTTTGPLTNTGSIDLGEYGASTSQPALLSIDSTAGLGTVGAISGDVTLNDDSTLMFASGEITTISSNSYLTIDGSSAFVADAATPTSNSALTGLTTVTGSLYIENGASVTTSGPLAATGEIELYSYGAAVTDTLDVGGVAGLAGAGVIGSYLNISENSLLEFQSGQITTISQRGTVEISGQSAFVADASNTSSNSALSGLDDIAGTLDLSDGATIVTTGALTLTGSLELDSDPNAPTTVFAAGSVGGDEALTGQVSLSGNAALEFASGGFTSIAQGGSLALSGDDAFVTSGGDVNSNSGLTGLASNAGTMVLGQGATLDLAGSFANTGSIGLNSYSSTVAATLSIAGAAGLGTAGVLTGSVDLSGNSLLEFASGSFNSIAAGASLQIDGDDAFVADADDLTSNSALTGLSSNAGQLELGGKTSLTTTGGLANSNNISIYDGAQLTIGGDLTGTGTVYIENNSTLTVDGGVSNTISFDQSQDATLVIGAPSQFTGAIYDLAVGDIIDLANTDATGASIVSTQNGQAIDIALADGTSLQYSLSSYLPFTLLSTKSDLNGGTNIVVGQGAAPVINSPTSTTVNEGVASSLGAISLTDTDPNAGTVSLVITDTLGTLAATQVGQATVSSYSPNYLQLSGDLADVNAELATLTYKGPLRTGASVSDTVYLSMGDTDRESAIAHIAVTVGPGAVSISTPTLITATQGEAASLGGIQIADTAAPSGDYTVTVAASDGILTGAASGAGSLAISGGDATLVGSLVDVNAELATLGYTSFDSSSGTPSQVKILVTDPNGAQDQQVVSAYVSSLDDNTGAIDVPAGESLATGAVFVNEASGTIDVAGDLALGAAQDNINFEDLQSAYYTGGEVDNPYHGFNWTIPGDYLEWYETSQATANTGYVTGSIAPGDVVAYIGYGGYDYIQQPLDVKRADGGDFVFQGVALTASYNTSMTVVLTGYLDGRIVGETAVVVGDKAPTFVNVNWGTINDLTIASEIAGSVSDSAVSGYPNNGLVLDNFQFLTESANPQWSNEGEIKVQSGGVLELSGAFDDSALSGVVNTGGTIDIDGAINNQGDDLAIGIGTTLGTLQLDATGSITGGTIADSGAGLVLHGGVLDDVVYQGTVDLSPADAWLRVTDGLQVESGAITLTGAGAALEFDATQSFDDVSITLGAAGAASTLESVDTTGTGATLTLGAGVIVDQSGKNAIISSSSNKDDGLVNLGQIDAAAANGSLSITGESFVNKGGLTITDDDVVSVSAATFDNDGGTIAIGDGELAIGYQPVVVNFDDLLNTDISSNSTPPLAAGYDGFNWTVANGYQFAVLDSAYTASTTGYSLLGAAGNGIVAFNGYGVTPIDITSASGQSVIFQGVDLAAAYDSSLQVTLTGYENGQVVGTTTLTTYDRSLSDVTVNWGPIDDLRITTADPSLDPNNINVPNPTNQLVMSDFSFLTPSAGTTWSNDGAITIAAGGTLRLAGSLTPAPLAGIINSGGTIAIEGTLTDNGQTLSTGAGGALGNLVVDASGVISGTGTILGPITIDGQANAVGGTLDIAGDISGYGTLSIGSNALLALGGTVSQTVDFSGANGTLELADPASFTGTVAGFSPGDMIDLVNTAVQSAAIVGSTLVVTETGGQTLTYQFSTAPQDDAIAAVTDGAGGTDLLLEIAEPFTAFFNAADALSADLSDDVSYTQTAADGVTGYVGAIGGALGTLGGSLWEQAYDSSSQDAGAVAMDLANSASPATLLTNALTLDASFTAGALSIAASASQTDYDATLQAANTLAADIAVGASENQLQSDVAAIYVAVAGANVSDANWQQAEAGSDTFAGTIAADIASDAGSAKIESDSASVYDSLVSGSLGAIEGAGAQQAYAQGPRLVSLDTDIADAAPAATLQMDVAGAYNVVANASSAGLDPLAVGTFQQVVTTANILGSDLAVEAGSVQIWGDASQVYAATTPDQIQAQKGDGALQAYDNAASGFNTATAELNLNSPITLDSQMEFANAIANSMYLYVGAGGVSAYDDVTQAAQTLANDFGNKAPTSTILSDMLDIDGKGLAEYVLFNGGATVQLFDAIVQAANVVNAAIASNNPGAVSTAFASLVTAMQSGDLNSNDDALWQQTQATAAQVAQTLSLEMSNGATASQLISDAGTAYQTILSSSEAAMQTTDPTMLISGIDLSTFSQTLLASSGDDDFFGDDVLTDGLELANNLADGCGPEMPEKFTPNNVLSKANGVESALGILSKFLKVDLANLPTDTALKTLGEFFKQFGEGLAEVANKSAASNLANYYISQMGTNYEAQAAAKIIAAGAGMIAEAGTAVAVGGALAASAEFIAGFIGALGAVDLAFSLAGYTAKWTGNGDAWDDFIDQNPIGQFFKQYHDTLDKLILSPFDALKKLFPGEPEVEPPPGGWPKTPPKTPTASAITDVHMTTFDGLHYDFQASGEFVLTKSSIPGETFQVQVRMQPWSAGSSVSVTTMVGAQVGDDTVTFGLGRDDLVWVDGKASSLSATNTVIQLNGGEIIEQSPTTYQINWNTGESLTVTDGGSLLSTQVSLGLFDFPGTIEGLLGPDEGQADDFMLPDGTMLSQPLTQAQLYGQFANAWRVTQDDSLLDYGAGQTTATFTDVNFPDDAISLADLPQSAVAQAAAVVAAAGITDPTLVADAELDYIATGDPSFVAADANGITGATQASVVATAPATVLGVSAVKSQLIESATTTTAVTFTAYLTAASSDDTVVDYTLSGSGAGDFSAPDFGGTAPSGSVTIAAGQTSAQFTITLPQDALGAAPSKMLAMLISSPTGDPLFAPTAATTIINSQPEPGALAQPVIEDLTDSTELFQNGNNYTINLGDIPQNAEPTIQLAIVNAAAGLADQLAGNLSVTSGSGVSFTGLGALSLLDAGGVDQSLVATLTTGAIGANSETITFSPQDLNVSGYSTSLPDITLTIEYVTQPQAQPVLNSSDIVTFGNARVGTPESQAVSITNASNIGSAKLDATASLNGSATSSGSIVGLAPGATNSTDLLVGLNTQSAGAVSGIATIDFFSDSGDGETNYLLDDAIDVFGAVYRPGAATVAPIIAHVGDPTTATLAIENSDPADGYSENLTAAVAGTTGSVTASGSTGDIAPQATSNGISVSFSTAAVGDDGVVELALTSDGANVDGLETESIGTQNVSVTVDNYAKAAFVDHSNGSTLTQDGSAYALNLGSVFQGSTAVATLLGVANVASGPADLLNGAFSISGDSAFTNAGFDDFANVGAGGSYNAPSVSLNTSQTGNFSETITLDPTGWNATGYSGALGAETLTIEGTVIPSAGLPPTITGTVGGQQTTSEAPVTPFATAVVGDVNPGADDTLTIALSGAGGTLAGGGLTVSNGVYQLSGSASAITAELEALTFTPTAGVPNTSSTTTFTLTDNSSVNFTPATDATTTVIDTDPAVAPTITGTTAGIETEFEAPVAPFSKVTIGDANANASDALTITLSGAGGTLADGQGFSGLQSQGGGVYELMGSAAAVTGELEALSFTPNAGAPDTNSTTGFALSDVSSAFATPSVNTTASVIDQDFAVAPTIMGTVGDQKTQYEAPIDPFAGVTIGDANLGASDTVTITLGGAGGTLAGAGLSGGAGGVYTLSGAVTAVTGELRALTFTANAGELGTTSTTTFALSDKSTAYATATDDATTSVVDSDVPVAPTVSGPSGETTRFDAPYAPFAGYTINDINPGADDTFEISDTGAGGTLSGAGLVDDGGVYTLTGAPSQIQIELDNLEFAPDDELFGTQNYTDFKYELLSDVQAPGGPINYQINGDDSGDDDDDGDGGDAWGDVHLATYDGLAYNFQAEGEFTLTQSTLPGDSFDVQVRLQPLSASASVSVMTEVAAKVGDDRVTFEIGRDDVVWVDGVASTLSMSHPLLSLSGGSVQELSSNVYQITWKTGETLEVDNDGAYFKTTATLAQIDKPGTLEGLLGTYKGAANDFTLSNGTVLSQPLSSSQLYGEFADSWRVTDDNTLFDYAPGQSTTSFTDKNFPDDAVSLADLPASVVAQAASLVAAAGITDPNLAADAELDYIETGDASYIASAAAVQSQDTQAGASTTAASVTAPPASAALGVQAASANGTITQSGEPTQVTFDVYLTSALTTATTVDYQVVTGGVGAFTSADFGGTAPTGQVTIAAGQTQGQFTIAAPAGALGLQPEKTLEVAISSSGAPLFASQAQTEVISGTPVAGAPAIAALEDLSGGGVLTQSGDDYTLNLGYIKADSGQAVTLGIANAATGASDELGGSLSVTSGSGFVFTGDGALTPVVAGGIFRGLIVSPAADQTGAGTETLTFTPLDLNDSGYSAALPTITLTVEDTVIPSAGLPPTITGTVGGQQTTSEAPVTPFATAVVGDVNPGGLTVSNGVYQLSGSASAITAELEALTFTPTAGELGTTSTTTFAISDKSAGYGAATVDTTTSVIDSDVPAAACYERGTRVTTEHGGVAIENLRIGDLLAVASGGFRPVVWIGKRRLYPRRHPRPEDVQPVRVLADAFGQGLPHRDVVLSPGHNIAFQGVLIPISALVNGASVIQEKRETVEYWHVELDAHDVILAEGLPAESYLDCGNRTAFENGGAFLEAHPDFRPRHWRETCLPLAKEGRVVEIARSQLRQRFSSLGFVVTTEADPHLLADGRRVEPIRLDSRRFGFLPPPESRIITLRSRSFVPDYSSVSNGDMRELGVSVARLCIDGVVVELDDPQLAAGWHDCEREGDHIARRWTNGAAKLPALAKRVLIDLAEEGLYWHRTESLDAAPFALARSPSVLKLA